MRVDDDLEPLTAAVGSADIDTLGIFRTSAPTPNLEPVTAAVGSADIDTLGIFRTSAPAPDLEPVTAAFEPVLLLASTTFGFTRTDASATVCSSLTSAVRTASPSVELAIASVDFVTGAALIPMR